MSGAVTKRVLRKAGTWISVTITVAVVIAGLIWEAKRLYASVAPAAVSKLPTAMVKRSDIIFTVSARGDLHGGNSEVLTAPLTTGSEMHLTSLRNTGELVKANDVVAEFDPTDQEYKLKESEADASETRYKVEQAKAQAEAQAEEDKYSLEAAETEVKTSELEAKKNPIVPTIQAKQNDLAVAAAHARLRQIQEDMESRKATNHAAIAVQEAALAKAEVEVATAKRNIDALTLKAHREGYVSLKSNTNSGFIMWGMSLPIFQVGDAVRGGMAIAEIPDLRSWEVVANIGELDRGHLAVGQKVDIRVVALPGQSYIGHISDLGGTAGPPWNRKFACKMKLDNPSADLRPGMSARIVVTTDELKKALVIPGQALFENGNRTFVYVPAGAGFTPKDVKLVRRSESQVVIEGLNEGQEIALANPEQQAQKKGKGAGPALPR